MNATLSRAALLLSLLCLIAGCVSDKPAPPKPNPDRAPRPLSNVAKQAQAAYMKQEGHDRRGPLFSDLVTAVDMEMASSGMWTRAELLDVLGPPDLEKEDNSEIIYAYFYNRSGKKDWVAYVRFKGTEVAIGRNDAAANQKFHSTMHAYSGG